MNIDLLSGFAISTGGADQTQSGLELKADLSKNESFFDIVYWRETYSRTVRGDSLYLLIY